VNDEYGQPREHLFEEIEAALNADGIGLSAPEWPANFDLEKGVSMIQELFNEEWFIEWLKEMAKR